MDRRRWRVTSTAGGLQHTEPKIWLKKCDIWFNAIEEWPSWSWNKKLASLTDPFMRFSPTIWRWDASVRSLFRGSWPRITCCAAIPRREKHSCHHSTTLLSGSRSEWLLAVPYSENGPQGDVFRNHGGHQIQCDGWTPEDSNSSLPLVLPTKAGSMEQARARARVLLWRWLGKSVICPTIMVLYHNSGNFLTAPRTFWIIHFSDFLQQPCLP